MSFNHHIHKIYSGINDSYTGDGDNKRFYPGLNEWMAWKSSLMFIQSFGFQTKLKEQQGDEVTAIHLFFDWAGSCDQGCN